MNMDMHDHGTSKGALIGVMRDSGWTMRSIASIVILTFGGLVTSPAVAAVTQEVQKIQWHKADSSNAAKLSAKLHDVHALMTRFASQGTKKTLAMADVSDQHSQIHGLISDLKDLDNGAMADFADTEAHIKAHHLPAVIEQRQQAAVKTYRARMDTLMMELKAADGAKDAATFQQHIANAKAFMDKVQVKPLHEKFDPKHLPFSVAKPTKQKPRLTRKDYLAHPVVPLKRVNVAANGSLAGIVTAADLGVLPASPSDPSYLAPTDDVQITPAIQAEAKALNNDPVQIYNWMHNNVEYIPTYGSIQGSDMTLQTLKGNDFDQASLLIALLRASNIPARYVYGTIQVPIAQVENWVGGVTDPNAALNLLGQGGVPVSAVVQGGQITYAQMEHVWVEAWVDYYPSHAARPGAGNAWVPMDSSFKQYTYTPGLDIGKAIPFDATSLINHTTSSATLNSDPSNLSVSNIDQSYIQQQISSYLTQISNYSSSLSPQTTFAQVVGAKSINAQTSKYLSGSTAYAVVTIGDRFAAIPDNMEMKFQYSLDDQNGNPIFSYIKATSDLAGHTLALSFSTATAADEALLTSYVPKSNSNLSSVQLTQFPESLPGYLISVIPELTLDGQVVASGPSTTLGSSLQSQKGFWNTKDGWYLSTKPITAGQYQAVALDLQGVSRSNLLQLEANLDGAIQALNSGTEATVPKSALVGSMLEYTGLSYLASTDSVDNISAKASGIVEYRAPSFGTFSTVVEPIYSFGIPSSIKVPGALMDMDGLKTIEVADDNSSSEEAFFNIEAGGRLSAFESLIPKTLYSEIDPTAQSISAVVAMQESLTQGMPVYIVNSANVSGVLGKLNVGAQVEARIQDVVAAGDVVSVPQSNASFGNWVGTGYVILDPKTGDGAYEISGAANGNAYSTDNNSMMPFGMEGMSSEGLGGSGVGSYYGGQGQDYVDNIQRVKDVWDIDKACFGSNLIAAATIYVGAGALLQTFKEVALESLASLVESGYIAATAALLGGILVWLLVFFLLITIVSTLIHDCEVIPNTGLNIKKENDRGDTSEYA